MISFNTDGIHSLQVHPEYSFLASAFEKLRIPAANAFVMNVLSMQPPVLMDFGQRRKESSSQTCTYLMLHDAGIGHESPLQHSKRKEYKALCCAHSQCA